MPSTTAYDSSTNTALNLTPILTPETPLPVSQALNGSCYLKSSITDKGLSLEGLRLFPFPVINSLNDILIPTVDSRVLAMHSNFYRLHVVCHVSADILSRDSNEK